MDARNLATIFAPSILRVDHDKLQETLAENESQVTIVETMISNVEEIFKVHKIGVQYHLHHFFRSPRSFNARSTQSSARRNPTVSIAFSTTSRKWTAMSPIQELFFLRFQPLSKRIPRVTIVTETILTSEDRVPWPENWPPTERSRCSRNVVDPGRSRSPRLRRVPTDKSLNGSSQLTRRMDPNPVKIHQVLEQSQLQPHLLQEEKPSSTWKELMIPEETLSFAPTSSRSEQCLNRKLLEEEPTQWQLRVLPLTVTRPRKHPRWLLYKVSR